MFRRMANLFRGFLGLFVSGVERRSPEALLEVEKENLRRQVVRFNQGLASHAAVCERLMARGRKLETEEQDLKVKTAAHLRAGNREVAGQYALRLQTASNDLTETGEQLRLAEETYVNLVQARDEAVRAAKAKIEALQHSIDALKAKKALAEMGEMASGMVTSVGGAGDTLDRLRAMVEEERERAAGRARVARDVLAGGNVDLQEVEQKALAEQALADFVAREALPPAPRPAGALEAAPPPKEPTPEPPH
jgi:phage shock protein A